MSGASWTGQPCPPCCSPARRPSGELWCNYFVFALAASPSSALPIHMLCQHCSGSWTTRASPWSLQRGGRSRSRPPGGELWAMCKASSPIFHGRLWTAFGERGASRLSQVSSRQMAQLCDHGWASSTSTTPSGVLHCRGARRSRFRAGGRWWRGSEHAGFFARAAGHLGTLHRQPGRRCHRSAECASDSRGLRAICRAQQSENSFSSCDQRGPFGGRLGKTQRTSRAGSCSRLGRAETVQQPSREPAADALAQVAAGVAQRQLRRWDPAAYRKRGSLAATARAIRANACAELGVPLSAAIPGLLREFLDKRVGLADHRTLAYFATFLAYGWQLAREADNIELEAYAGRGIMMVEQMVDGVGRWPAPSGLVTGWPSGSQARKHNSLRPFSKLAKPAWCAANLTFLRDLDNLEARLKAAREQKTVRERWSPGGPEGRDRRAGTRRSRGRTRPHDFEVFFRRPGEAAYVRPVGDWLLTVLSCEGLRCSSGRSLEGCPL